MKRHCAANQTVIQIEKTLTDNTDTGAVPRWYDTTAHYQTYVTGQIFKQLHDNKVDKCGNAYPITRLTRDGRSSCQGFDKHNTYSITRLTIQRW